MREWSSARVTFAAIVSERRAATLTAVKNRDTMWCPSEQLPCPPPLRWESCPNSSSAHGVCPRGADGVQRPGGIRRAGTQHADHPRPPVLLHPLRAREVCCGGRG